MPAVHVAAGAGFHLLGARLLCLTNLSVPLPFPQLLLALCQMPPRGVQWEVSYSRAGQPRSTTLPADKDFDNVLISKLTPGGWVGGRGGSRVERRGGAGTPESCA
jgi:hypothetical protein